MTTCYITFGQRYAYEDHPVDERAHPDGWFEFVAPTYGEAVAGAQSYLMGVDDHGNTLPLYAFDYARQPDGLLYDLGCLARFDVVRGKTTEVKA